jgi:glycosyltransferase involved in cell wall biosynthesis
MAAADVVVQPSLCESYCQTLVEALTLGRAVIMTPVGAAPEIIGADERGLLVPRSDPTALAAALDRLLGDPALRAALGTAGSEFVRSHLTPAASIRRHESVYVRRCCPRIGARRFPQRGAFPGSHVQTGNSPPPPETDRE